MNKTIIFILDSFELYQKYDTNGFYIKCYSYFDTEEAIANNMPLILTYDLMHLSFDLEDLEYTILIGYNGICKEIHVGMTTANGKELRKAHDLRRILTGGGLDNDLNIDRKKFYYDKNKSTKELLDDQLINEKIDLFSRVLNDTNDVNNTNDINNTIKPEVEASIFANIKDKNNKVIEEINGKLFKNEPNEQNDSNESKKEVKKKRKPRKKKDNK